MDKKAIVQRALENVNHPLSEITGRTKFRGHSPTVKPVTGIKLVLPKTSKMAEKIEMVLGGDDPVKLKKMNRLVIGREEDEKEYRLEFKSAASREKFRKMMNEEVYNGHSVEDIKEAVAADPQGMVKGLSNKAKKEIADELNRMQLSGYGDYEASPKNVHKFRPADLMAAMIKIMKLESLDEEKSLFDISPTSSKWMKGKLRVGYNQSQKSGMPKEMFKKGQVIDLHPFDGDRFVGAKSPKDKGSYFFVAKRHVDAMKEEVQLDEKVMTFTFRKTEDAREFESKAFSLANSTDIMMMPGGKTGVEVSTMGPKDDKRLISLAKKMGGRVHKIVEDVQIEESSKRFGIKTMKFSKILSLSKAAKDVFASAINMSQTAGVPGMDAPLATANNLQKFSDGDFVGALVYLRKNSSKLPAGGRKYAKEILDALGDEITEMQVDEEVIKARVAFFGRPSKNNSDMRDAKKKNMFVDAKDVDAAKGKMFDVTFNSRRQFNRFESEYDFLMVKVFEDVQIDEERVPTYVIDRQSKKIVHGPTDTADAKLYMKKQIQPRKFMIRQIRGEAKKVGDTV